MSNKNQIVSFLSELKHCIFSDGFKEKYVSDSKSFSRKRKLSFTDCILFLIGLPHKSLPVELDSFFEQSNKDTVSKQAFSKARRHISSEAFQYLFKLSTNINKFMDLPELFHGHRLFAVDGTEVMVADNKTTRDEFGVRGNKVTEYVCARATALYDIVNDHICDVCFTGSNIGEREHASTLVESDALANITGKPPIILFDRGYPSRSLVQQLNQKGYLFLIRSSTSFLKCVNECGLGDHSVIDVHKSGDTKLRVIKFPLPTGEEETLVTNILDKRYHIKFFKDLYSRRWGIETKYGELKNQLQIEYFAGRNPECIRQEFYVSLLISNIVAAIKRETDEKIICECKKNKRKTTYQTNRGYLISLFINKIRKILQTEIEKIMQMVNEIRRKGIKIRSQIRPNRKCKRKSDHHVKSNRSYKKNVI